MKVSSLFGKISKEFDIEFGEIAKEIGHPAKSGEAREHALRKMLDKYLPKRVGVDQGFVVDALGRESRQIDIVIYDMTAATVFEAAGTKYFPCEIVLAVGEVRTNIDSKGNLEDALSKIRSVKELDRSNQGKNRMITGPGISVAGLKFDPSTWHRDQIFGFIFTGSSMRQETVLEVLQEYNSRTQRPLWLNVFCAYRDFLISYKGEGSLTPSAMDAEQMYCTTQDEIPHLFMLFISILATFVNEAHIARPNYFSYANIITTMHTSHPLLQQSKTTDRSERLRLRNRPFRSSGRRFLSRSLRDPTRGFTRRSIERGEEGGYCPDRSTFKYRFCTLDSQLTYCLLSRRTGQWSRMTSAE